VKAEKNPNVHGGIEKMEVNLHGTTMKIGENHKKTFAIGAKK
jgi:hypothetical protein